MPVYMARKLMGKEKIVGATAKTVLQAKEYISKALKAFLDLGRGSGPIKHNFEIK